MDFKDLIKSRRSCRTFTEEPLTEEQVVALMRAALMSPSSHRTNGWQFVLVDDREKLHALSACKEHGSGLIDGAPLAIVVCADSSVSDVWIEDASTAAMSILYQSEALGLGACWVQVRNRKNAEGVDSEVVVRDILSLPENMRVVCFLAIGHKGMERKGQNMEKIAALKADKVIRI
jgi:nitroreductase